MGIKLWAPLQFSSQLLMHSDHCLFTVPPTHPNMGISHFKTDWKFKMELTNPITRLQNGYSQTNW